MTDIYIDASVAGMPDALDQLAHLADTGHRVLVIRAPVGTVTRPGATPHGLEEILEMPDPLPAKGWFVTTDPARCSDRPAGLRTLLIAPGHGDGPRPTIRCDGIARDVRSAVLDILAHDAMD